MTGNRNVCSVELDVGGIAARQRKVSAAKVRVILQNHSSESQAQVKHDGGIGPACVECIDSEVHPFMSDSD
jgi:hypothetical protein